MEKFLQDASWWRALTLQERLKLSRNSVRKESVEPVSPAAASRLADWRSQSPFQIEPWLTKRLELAGSDEVSFAGLLGESAETLRNLSPTPPSWLLSLIEAFRSQTQSALPPGTGCYFSSLFSPLVEAALERGENRIKDASSRHPKIPFAESQIRGFLSAGLESYLDSIVSRTAVLELKISSLEGRLEGDTPEDRFQSFIRGLRRPEGALTLLSEYPVLARILVETVSGWVESRIEFLDRFLNDWELLRCTFQIDQAEILEEVSGGFGDRHSGGRSVLLARFVSGKKVVYKPRSLAIDERFATLLAWLSSKGSIDLRIPQVLIRESYGWCEFAAAKSCCHPAELERFYSRQGSLLAVLYALEANDFHRENLIAQGEHPTLIDLESLCKADFGLGQEETYRSIAAFVLTTSVLQVGLLPQPRKGKDGDTIDFSGLGGRAGQRWLQEIPTWENVGTDNMRLTWQRQEIAACQNQPFLYGKAVNPLDYSDQILSGFETTYRLLLQHRDELLSSDGILQGFAATEVRTIFRVTQFYATLLNESMHPDVLRDALDRDRLFDRIWFGLDQNPLADIALRIIPSEQSELWKGDIPCFRNRVDSLDTYSNQTLIQGALIQSGLDAVRSRFSQLGEDDLARQKWLIRSSLVAFEMEIEGNLPRYTVEAPPEKVSRSRLLKEASRIGDRLIQSAISKDSDPYWIGLSILGDRWVLRPLSVDLYSGLPGVALFLAVLGKLVGSKRYTLFANKTLQSIREQLKNKYSPPKQIGAFEGWGGLIYLWTRLSLLWNDDSLLEEASNWLDKLTPLIGADSNLDVVGGAAGGIIALLKFSQASGSELSLQLAVRMGDHLLSKAQPAYEGIGWTGPTDESGPLAGFSHGASGVALALFQLHRASGEIRFREAALQALAFEASVFSEGMHNWPDLRQSRDLGSPTQKFMTAWCHGAPGIGLSRLRMLDQGADPRIQRDIAAALKATSASGFGSNHSLCHGDLGNLDLFLEAGRVIGGPTCLHELDARTSQVVSSIEAYGWLCGVPKGVETPGLMNGLAGIGYGLLRLASPNEVPSVLLLE